MSTQNPKNKYKNQNNNNLGQNSNKKSIKPPINLFKIEIVTLILNICRVIEVRVEILKIPEEEMLIEDTEEKEEIRNEFIDL